MIIETPQELAEELAFGLRHETDEATTSTVEPCSPMIVPPRASFNVETLTGKRFCVMVTELWT